MASCLIYIQLRSEYLVACCWYGWKNINDAINYALGGNAENIDTQEVVSAPDPMAELNQLAIELFGKSLDQLNETEKDQLQKQP